MPRWLLLVISHHMTTQVKDLFWFLLDFKGFYIDPVRDSMVDFGRKAKLV